VPALIFSRTTASTDFFPLLVLNSLINMSSNQHPRHPSQPGGEGHPKPEATARPEVNGIKPPSQQPVQNGHEERETPRIPVSDDGGMRYHDDLHELDRK